VIEQRTQEWKKLRLGHITASEISVLLKDRKVQMTEEELAEYKAANPKSRATTKMAPFSDATFTYLNRKVMENLLPVNSDDTYAQNCVDEYIELHSQESAATRYGTEMESMARDKYAEAAGYEVYESEFVPYKVFPKLVGGSPDGLIRQEKGIIEIKCPFTLEKHLQHIMYNDQCELKENEEEYYWQCVSNMLFTDTEFCDFVSYCPYVSKSKQLKILRVHRDENEIKLLSDRIALGVSYMKEQLSLLSKVNMIIK